ncbi:histidinol-phosphate transaminase [Bacillus sp. FSL K6-3431]|uniref:histidinol-phosphate transaminase n=1 Tax=Bacillus sp. FSL K6-3431 TaxID=2921500 RepID=UPI0030FB4AFC
MKVKKQLLTLDAYVPGKSSEEVRKEFGLNKIVKLASNENPYGSSPAVLEAISTAIPSFAIYPDGAAIELRERVAYHVGVNENQLLFSSGLDELIQIISRAILSSDTNTIMAQGTFPQYKHHAVIENAEIREVALKNGLHDLDEMAKRIDENTKIIWICNPNNPTGTYVNQMDLEQFLARVPADVLVVLDEAYYEYAIAEDYPQTIPLLKQYENLLVLRTFSKAYGLAAFRIGYGMGSAAFIKQLEVTRLPFNTSVLAQTAAIAALQDLAFVEDSIDKNSEEKQRFYHFFDQHQIVYYPSQTNFIYLNIPGKSSGEVFQFLLEKGFIIRPFPEGVRITIGTEQENKELLQHIEQMIAVKL